MKSTNETPQEVRSGPGATVPLAPPLAEELMDWLRADMSARALGLESRPHVEVAPLPPSLEEPAPIGVSAWAELPLWPVMPAAEDAPLIGRKDAYHLSELLAFRGNAFLRNAFVAVLRREPDAGGIDHFRSQLAEGHLTREEVILELRESAEGVAAGVSIQGLRLVSLLRRMRPVPLVGRILSMVVHLYRLPQLAREQERMLADFGSRIDLERRRTHDIVLAIREAIAARDGRESKGHAATGDAIAQLVAQLGLARGHALALSRTIGTLGARDAALVKWAGAFGEQVLEGRRLVDSLGKRADRAAARSDEQLLEIQRLNDNLTKLEARESARNEEQLLEVQRLNDSLGKIEAREASRSAMPEGFYAAFEDRFRGAREDIKGRVSVYLPRMREAVEAAGNAEVLDIGCGRGEWLEVLKENGIAALGLDSDAEMVARATTAGLRVVHADALEHLAEVPDASLAGVTAFHVVEHLPFGALLRLINEAHRVLRPGGLAIFETPNPENLQVGAFGFWHDPTHQRPLPPAVLSFFAESSGFAEVEILRLHPAEAWDRLPEGGDADLRNRLNDLLYGARDYAIIARKA